MLATDFIEELGHALDIPGLMFNEDLLCFIAANGGNLDVTIETDETYEQIYICAHLGTMPDDDNAAAAVALLFAQANGVLAAMNKGVLVLDYNGQGLMLVKLYTLKTWVPEECMTSILQLITDAIEWKERLQLPDFGLGGFETGANIDSTGPDSFLRV